MEKQVREIAKWIKENWGNLPKSKIDEKKLVIFATGDFSGEYGYGSSDLQGWGVDENGELFWAFASGCSCNCSAGTEEKTMKSFGVEKFYEGDTNILKAIGLFNSDKEAFKRSIGSHSYESY